MSDIRTIQAYDPAEVRAWLAVTDGERNRLRRRLEQLRADEARLANDEGINERMAVLMRQAQADIATIREQAEARAREILELAEAEADRILHGRDEPSDAPASPVLDVSATAEAVGTQAPIAEPESPSAVPAPSVPPPDSWVQFAKLEAAWR